MKTEDMRAIASAIAAAIKFERRAAAARVGAGSDFAKKLQEQATHVVATLDAHVDARVAELEAKIASAERRLSRHAEHLAKLETKLQTMKGDR